VAPPTHGCPVSLYRARVLRQSILSTRVGVNRRQTRRSCARSNCPHACGGEAVMLRVKLLAKSVGKRSPTTLRVLTRSARARAGLFRDVMRLRLHEGNQAIEALRDAFVAARAQEDPFALPTLPFEEGETQRAAPAGADPFAAVEPSPIRPLAHRHRRPSSAVDPAPRLGKSPVTLQRAARRWRLDGARPEMADSASCGDASCKYADAASAFVAPSSQ
jgi:hypothetical protein